MIRRALLRLFCWAGFHDWRLAGGELGVILRCKGCRSVRSISRRRGRA